MCFSYICMKEEVIKEIIELTKERDKILSQFREYFGVTDPKFQPASLSFSDDEEGSISLVGKNGRHYCTFTVSGKLIIETTRKEIPIDGIPVAIKWIEDEIKKLESINKRLEEL